MKDVKYLAKTDIRSIRSYKKKENTCLLKH